MPATLARVALAASLLLLALPGAHADSNSNSNDLAILGPCDPLQWFCDHLQGGIDEFCRESKELEPPSHHHYCGSAYGA